MSYRPRSLRVALVVVAAAACVAGVAAKRSTHAHAANPNQLLPHPNIHRVPTIDGALDPRSPSD